MNLIDMKTVIISYIISNAVCAAVMTFLWWQNRKRFAGLVPSNSGIMRQHLRKPVARET